jgi:CRISPR-associated protein Csy3
MSLRDFETTSAEIEELATEIANALSGKEDFLLLEINAFAQIGKAQDVYPSEELVLDKKHSKR